MMNLLVYCIGSRRVNARVMVRLADGLTNVVGHGYGDDLLSGVNASMIHGVIGTR
jgi:hypothetical protein